MSHEVAWSFFDTQIISYVLFPAIYSHCKCLFYWVCVLFEWYTSSCFSCLAFNVFISYQDHCLTCHTKPVSDKRLEPNEINPWKDRFPRDMDGVSVMSPDGKHGKWCEDESQLSLGFLSNISKPKARSPQERIFKMLCQGWAVLKEDVGFAEGINWLER